LSCVGLSDPAARVQGSGNGGGVAGRMDGEQRLRRALAAFGGDVWALVDATLAAAARDRPAELRARRVGIVERLYACSNCVGRAPRAALAAAGVEEENEGEEEEVVAAAAAAAVSPEPEADADADHAEEADELGGEASGLETKILAIRDFLEDPEQVPKEALFTTSQREFAPNAQLFSRIRTFLLFCQPEDELVSLLQNLEDMDVTYKALQVKLFVSLFLFCSAYERWMRYF
jgi:hypothetical protein